MATTNEILVLLGGHSDIITFLAMSRIFLQVSAPGTEVFDLYPDVAGDCKIANNERTATVPDSRRTRHKPLYAF